MTTTEQPTDDLAVPEPPGARVATLADGGPATDGAERAAHRVRSFLIAAAGYLAVSLVVWWHVWTSHPTSVTTCGCGDTSLFTWFLEWPAYALSHGLSPLFSTALFHPSGVNLLSNTAEVGIGVVLAPVTWAFGPVATLNVALTLSPVLSALGMYILLRRWVSWAPAAFAGGLLYGFSPFILIALTDAHLMLAMTPIPPLIVACLDELLVRQHRRPVLTGVLLGVLVAVQFFIGSEMLVLTLLPAAFGVALVVVVCGIRTRELIRRKARHALVAAGSAALTGGVLLAYPLWYALDGPARLAGPIWGPNSEISFGGTTLKDYLVPTPPSTLAEGYSHQFGGYQGPMLSGQYIGIGLLVVLVVGLIVWRQDLRLWLFAVVGALTVPLSFGLQFHTWTLWRLFVRLPLMDNIIPSRFLLVTYLCAAVMLGLIADHARADIPRWLGRPAGSTDRRLRHAGGVAGAAIALVALIPIAWYDAGGLPFTTQAVVLPPWFRDVAPNLSGRQVLLAFPFASLQQSTMTWQAVDTMSYAMIGGGGPSSLPERAGRERAANAYLGSLSKGETEVTTSDVASVRQALRSWGVTTVVVPDPAGLPRYEQTPRARTIITVMTAATGRLPIRQAHAWVWTDVGSAGPPILAPAVRLTACGVGAPNGPVASLYGSAMCVLAAHRTGE